MPKGTFEKLSKANCDYFAEDRSVGIFVQGLNNNKTHHSGFVFAFEDFDENTLRLKCRETRRLDFIDNHSIKFEAFSPDKQWLHAAIDLKTVHDVTALTAFLIAVSKSNEGESPILYGLKWLGVQKCFNEQGEYIKPDAIDGLTCATFISEIIAAPFGAIVDFKDWQEAMPEDIEWKKAKTDGIRNSIAKGNSSFTVDQVEVMEQMTDFKRLRPSHAAVAAAAGNKRWVMSHKDVDALAAQVIADFQKALPPSKPKMAPTPTASPPRAGS